MLFTAAFAAEAWHDGGRHTLSRQYLRFEDPGRGPTSTAVRSAKYSRLMRCPSLRSPSRDAPSRAPRSRPLRPAAPPPPLSAGLTAHQHVRALDAPEGDLLGGPAFPGVASDLPDTSQPMDRTTPPPPFPLLPNRWSAQDHPSGLHRYGPHTRSKVHVARSHRKAAARRHGAHRRRSSARGTGSRTGPPG